MDFLKNKSILITGGTGSLGKQLIKYLLENTEVRRIAIFSRDELKQHNLKLQFQNNDRLRWFLGDIRDLSRLRRAFHEVDFVVHAAALKQVDSGEYNPMEFVKTNVIGSQNVIDAAIDAGVEKVIALSTDKASSPINLYGATKLTADKLFVAANNYGHKYGTKLSVVRYGNVVGSRGSVIPMFQELIENNKPLPITDVRMTRFWISLESAVLFVLESLRDMGGGELYVPRIPSMRIIDLIRVMSPTSSYIEVGIRPGEKLHEEMISADDSRRTIIEKDRFIITPIQAEWGFTLPTNAKYLNGNAYRSDTNDLWVTDDQIRQLLSGM